MKAGQVSGLEVPKAFPQLAALIENLKANPSGTSAAITPQITPITPGKGKWGRQRQYAQQERNVKRRCQHQNSKVATFATDTRLAQRSRKATKTHLTIKLPSNKRNQAKVLNIPFKELKTLTGVDRSDRCWPYCIPAMLIRTKGTSDADRRDTDEARNNFGLLYCPCHTSTGHTKPGREMHEIPEALTTDVVRNF